MKKPLPEFELGSGNIFADIGLPNAEEHLLKAGLVVRLGQLIKARKLTQTAAAKLLGVKQPDLSNVLRGHFRGYSVERLMRMLTAFDQDIDIVVRPHKKAGKPGRIALIEGTAHRLEDDPRFLRRIEQARKSVRARRGVRLEYI
jgi:predicted XRE-type DNA-binding protein